jgi:hypothetical protein
VTLELWQIVRHGNQPQHNRQHFLPGTCERIPVIDFSSREAASSYNILSRCAKNFFVTSRLETLQEL